MQHHEHPWWMEQVDGYCERVGLDFWAEPINAITNLAFLISALIVGRLVWKSEINIRYAWVLLALLTAIGTGSFLFHSYATIWAAIADVLPILLFILAYIFATHRVYWNHSHLISVLWIIAFFPYAFAVGWGAEMLGFLGSSAGYAPVPPLILIHAWLLRDHFPETAKNLAIGAVILIVSLIARTIDEPLCAIIPSGTHFLWHILNAIMLGWMIETLRRHQMAVHYGRDR